MKMVMRILLLLVINCFNSALAHNMEIKGCIERDRECVEKGEYRTISGIKVYRDCWRYKSIMDCASLEGKDCLDINPNECILSAKECSAHVEVGGAKHCSSVKKTYSCSHIDSWEEEEAELITDPDKDVSKALMCNIFCLDGKCGQVQKAKAENKDNNEMAESIAQLQMLADARKGMGHGDDFNFNLFKGERKSCSKKITGYTACCGDGSGWGKSLGIVGCNDTEKQLAKDVGEGKCQLIGTYCSSETFGVCTIKSTVYCCYPTVLSKEIQIGARKQLSKGFGSPEAPRCEGFTLEEMAEIDFSQIDFKEFWNRQIVPNLTAKAAIVDHAKLIKHSMPTLKAKEGFDSASLAESDSMAKDLIRFEQFTNEDEAKKYFGKNYPKGSSALKLMRDLKQVRAVCRTQEKDMREEINCSYEENGAAWKIRIKAEYDAITSININDDGYEENDSNQ